MERPSLIDTWHLHIDLTHLYSIDQSQFLPIGGFWCTQALILVQQNTGNETNEQ